MHVMRLVDCIGVKRLSKALRSTEGRGVWSARMHQENRLRRQQEDAVLRELRGYGFRGCPLTADGAV